MKIREKILMDMKGLEQNGPINVVIFGDSVSHGAVNGYIDYENVYWNQLKKRLNRYREYVPVNMINASIGGTTAKESLPRMEKQVFCHCPDLVIVCFGLNDVNGPLEDYLDSLEKIFRRCLEAGCEAIFMSPNMLNTYVAEDAPAEYRAYAAKTAAMQNEGRMDLFMASAVKLAEEMGITVCDCYSQWKKLAETEDVTMLLANRINHPIPEMHRLFADALYSILLPKADNETANDGTMFKDQ